MPLLVNVHIHVVQQILASNTSTEHTTIVVFVDVLTEIDSNRIVTMPHTGRVDSQIEFIFAVYTSTPHYIISIVLSFSSVKVIVGTEASGIIVVCR